MPRRHPVFQPVVLIPPEEQTDLDKRVQKRTFETFYFIKTVMNTARSKQKRIGVSEFGDPCRKCVARKLAMVDSIEDPNWKAQIGTFGHAGLEQHYLDMHPWMYDVEYVENEDAPGGWERIIKVKPELVATDAQPLYHLERRVVVGTIPEYGFVLDGSCDMFEEGATYGVVRDWKFQGKTSLEKSGKGNIGEKYHTQMNGYGMGYLNLGKNVTHVELWALPRDDEYEATRPVLMRFEPMMAVNAIARVKDLLDAHAILGSWEPVIEAQSTASGCWDCKRYDDAEEKNFVSRVVGGR